MAAREQSGGRHRGGGTHALPYLSQAAEITVFVDGFQPTNAEVISAIMRAEAQSLRQVTSDCPKGLDRIVEQCSRKDRDKRYQSASELLSQRLREDPIPLRDVAPHVPQPLAEAQS